MAVSGRPRTEDVLTFTATARGGDGTTLAYRFFLYDFGTGTWLQLRGWTFNPILSWGFLNSGSFLVQVQVKRGSESLVDDAVNTEPFTIVAAPVVVTSFRALVGFPVAPGTRITWEVAARGGDRRGGYRRYKFWRYNVSTGEWTMGGDYTTDPWFSWTPSASEQGTYVLQVWVKDDGSTADYDGFASTAPFQVDSTFPVTAGVKEFDRRPAAGRSFALDGSATFGGATPLWYKWWTQFNGGAWRERGPYVSNGTRLLFDDARDGAVYRAQLWVKQTDSTASYESVYDTGDIIFTHKDFLLIPNITGTLPVGTPFTLIAMGVPEIPDEWDTRYVFNRRSPNGVWSTISDGTSPQPKTFSEVLGGCSVAPCPPVETGEYLIEVYRYVTGRNPIYATFRYTLVASQ